MAGHQKLTTTNSEDHWNWSSYNHMRSWPRTWLWPFYGSSAFEANWKDEKLNKWVPHELMENHHCEVLSFLILHTVMIKSVPGPRRSSEALPKAKFSPKKRVLVTVGLLPFWSTTTFWILVKLLHLRTMLSKSMRCTKNYNACCQHWLTERAEFFSATMSNCTTNASEVEKLGYKVLPHLQYSPDLSPTDYHFVKILTTFCSENDSTISKKQKMLSKSV